MSALWAIAASDGSVTSYENPGRTARCIQFREDEFHLGTEQLDWLNETNLGTVVCHRLFGCRRPKYGPPCGGRGVARTYS